MPLSQRFATISRFFALLTLALLTTGSLAERSKLGPPDAPSASLPNLGDGASMTPSAERRLGDRIARELYRDPDYIDDPVIMEYVQGIWTQLLAASRQRGELQSELDSAYAWQILMGKDRSVNAFALPGGYFGLHLGLVAVVGNQDELASVLAHELSHVTQRHISRLIDRQSEQAPWVLGAMILGALAASRDPQAANALIVGGQAASAQAQLNFSRDMEREADRIGFGVLSQAGYDPQGFVSMFEKLQQASRLDAGAFPYLRSHPLTTERMADMQLRVPPRAPGAAFATAPTLEHAMVSARARVLANGGVDALRSLQQESSAQRLSGMPTAVQAGVLYGAALAAVKLRDFGAATALLARLQRLCAGDAVAAKLANLLAAEAWLAQGNAQRALKLLTDKNAAPQKEGRATLLLRAQAAIQSGNAASVTQALQTRVADEPHDAAAWQWLADAYTAQGRTLGAVRAEAEASVAQLNYGAADARFKAAQDLVRKGVAASDHIEASIIDTRSREIRALLREQALER